MNNNQLMKQSMSNSNYCHYSTMQPVMTHSLTVPKPPLPMKGGRKGAQEQWEVCIEHMSYLRVAEPVPAKL